MSTQIASKQRPSSVPDVKKALMSFLADATPTIVGLSGKWGSGKTYFWREFLRSHVQESDERNYSYISLFGLGDLQHLKDAVFENAVVMGSLLARENHERPSWLTKSGIEARAKIVQGFARRMGGFAERIPKLGDVAAFARAAAFLTVKNYVVCIDDLERRGTGLSLKDVLGLATFLRDQRNCRVLVVLNSDALDADRDEYDRLREKVFDYEIVFEPTSPECAEIAFGADERYQQARSDAVSLGITNIRVLFRIRRAIDALLRQATNASEGIRRQLVNSAVLLGWSYNTRDGTAPDYEFIKKLSFGRIYDKVLGKESSEEEKQWSVLLEKYDYSNTDEIDLAICDTFERGFPNTEQLQALLSDRGRAERRAEIEQAFHEAWQIVHGGFGDDAERLAEAFSTSFRAAPELISANNASATIGLLREIGRDQLADELMQEWIEATKRENPGALDLRRNHWASDIQDKRFREAVDTAFAAMAPARPPLAEVVDRLTRQNDWSEVDIEVLVGASVQDFHQLFKSMSGSNTGVAVRACLRFKGLGGDSNYQKIGLAAEEALRLIAAESPLNTARLRRFGIVALNGAAKDANGGRAGS